MVNASVEWNPSRSGLPCQRTPPMHCNMPPNHASRRKRFLPRRHGSFWVKQRWEFLGGGGWSIAGCFTDFQSYKNT